MGIDHSPTPASLATTATAPCAAFSDAAFTPPTAVEGRITLMTKTVAYHWHLRKIMNEHAMFATTERCRCWPTGRGDDLDPGLPDRGRRAGAVEHAAARRACDIFDVTPNDPIEPYARHQRRRGRKTGTTGTSTPSKPSRNRPDPCGHQVCWGLTGCMASTIVHGECFRRGRVRNLRWNHALNRG